MIVRARIHPAIGIARVGNSESEYFIGPEIPHPQPIPEGGYKDPKGKLKRQAARFRIYGYDENGDVVAELTASEAEIAWSVHLANRKAAWYDFVVALDLEEAAAVSAPRRNAFIQGADRRVLVIDPGPRSIQGRLQEGVAFDSGRFFDVSVYLGELRTDEDGRLLVLGGRGVSGTPFPNNSLTTFANNPGWYDDTSDGPVHARVTIEGREIPVDPAWVVVAPPNYAPDIVTPQTMYDVIYDAMVGARLRRHKPSFTRDILPLLEQLSDAQWVNAGFFAQFGWQAPNELVRSNLLSKLAAPGEEFQELRRSIFYLFRNPGATAPNDVQWPPIYGDAFGNFDESPEVELSVTRTLYGYLRSWMNGDFIDDFDPNRQPPASLEDVALAEQPDTLDRAALHFCMGGPFHPGCEMTWPMRQPAMYRAPFRIRERPEGLSELDYGEFLTQALVLSDDGPLSNSGPGDITKWMAVPWQTDTASCRSGYPTSILPADPYLPTFWPARVPNQVLTEQDYEIVMDPEQPPEVRRAAFNTRLNWLRGLNLTAPYIQQITTMVHRFGELGVIERREGPSDDSSLPSVFYVETGFSLEQPQELATLARTSRGAELTSEEFLHARFGGPGRRR
jgi:hypothetical protein